MVVNPSGWPSERFITARTPTDVLAEQKRVLGRDWLEEHTPTPVGLWQAAVEHPSCGTPEAAALVDGHV
jgi:hypothetical protein